MQISDQNALRTSVVLGNVLRIVHHAYAQTRRSSSPTVARVCTGEATRAGKEQIELLARTTVLVSTIGSRSFRLVYLPDGAQMVIVGPPLWRRTDGSSTFPFPFDETDRCWGFLGYVNVLRQHVVLGKEEDRPPVEDDKNSSDFERYLAERDRTVTLDVEKLLPTVRHALRSVREWHVPDFSTGRAG